MKLANMIWLSGIVVLLGLSGCTDGNRVYSVHAVGDDVVIDAGGSVEIAVLENDTATADGDIDVSDNLILNYITQQPIHGSVTKDGNTIVYAHDGTDSTTDSFKYEAAISPGTIDMKTDEASVTITIRQPDSPPTNTKPVANTSIIYMDPECRVDVIVPFEHNLTGSDADGDSLTFELVSDPTYGKVTVESNGSGTFTLKGSEDSNRCMDGMDNNFTFKVNDGIEDSDPAMVEIQNPV